MPSAKRGKRNAVAVAGPWLPLPLELLRSRAFAVLSPKASRLFLDLLSQLGPNASGNGDLDLSPGRMRARGWRSNADKQAAIAELERAQLLVVTRRGDRRRPNLYALTPWPLNCDLQKLDVTPGVYTRSDWQQGSKALAEPPTEDRPAVWHAFRKNENSVPTMGEPPTDMHPSWGNRCDDSATCRPTVGSYRPETTAEVHP